MGLATWRVEEGDHGLEVCRYVGQKLEHVSQKMIRRHIDAGHVFINGRAVVRANAFVVKGDVIQYRSLLQRQRHESCSILYEDEEFIAINKPAGVTSSEEEIRGILPERGAFFMVHRLDKETSGVLLLAKNQQARACLDELFRTRKMEKRYLAVVVGAIREKSGTVDIPLFVEKRSGGTEAYVRKAQVGENGALPANTEWEVVERFSDATLLSVRPTTGRTHQIRVHMRLIGYPLVGEKKYQGAYQTGYSVARHMLHARSLLLHHPLTKEKVFLEAPCPHDMKSLIESARHGLAGTV